ncbi:MAG TPA: ankyrin repeat domain-containing protein [Gammaproteobacteria bacterium]
MTSRPLPERAHLAQLKKQAKSVLQSARANDPAALWRFRILPALAGKSIDELGRIGLALHDAQAVLAREHGFKSWNRLREHVEERSLSFAAAVDEFVRCATGGAAARALRLLELHPGIAHASLEAELVLGDAAAVGARLAKEPALVARPTGVRGWEPLLYVCQTCLHHDAPERAAGLVAVARELLARGANPNAEYDWNWHNELPRTALWGALCVVRHLPLAEALLEAGANPTDGVSLHIAAGFGDLAALDLLHRFGADVNGVPGGVPPLRYILGWVDPAGGMAGVRWLLEHGADPNLAWSEPGDAPLHVAAQRMDLATVELLVRHGADVQQRRADGRTAHAIAALNGNADIARWLLEHGARDELSLLEGFVAACTHGDRPLAERMRREHPALPGELRTEHHRIVHVLAERGDAGVLETMLACGFDPNVKDAEGVTALHRAAMAGRAGSVRALLEHGAAVNALDDTFAATPLLWAAQGWSEHAPPGADHPAVARLLIEAGSSLEWAPPEKAPHRESTQEKLAALVRAAGAAAPG